MQLSALDLEKWYMAGFEASSPASPHSSPPPLPAKAHSSRKLFQVIAPPTPHLQALQGWTVMAFWVLTGCRVGITEMPGEGALGSKASCSWTQLVRLVRLVTP